MKQFVLVTRVPTEGQPFKTLINQNNIVAVSPKGANESWLKHWDGEKIRSSVIEESPEQIMEQVST